MPTPKKKKTTTTNADFPDTVRVRALLWCDRHCCLCKKQCGTNIECHHVIPIEKGGTNDQDNAIPLCFDCHADVEHYNAVHPRGTKYTPKELKTRREQVYEEFTRHLVPPIDVQITQLTRAGSTDVRMFPNVSFWLTHLCDSLPVKVRIRIESRVDETQWRFVDSDYYSGQRFWHLNPRMHYAGHFELAAEFIPPDGRPELRVWITVTDQFEREHAMLPIGFVFEPKGVFWFCNP